MPFNFIEDGTETTAAFLEKFILQRNRGEVPESGYCGLCDPFVPSPGNPAYSLAGIDFNPVTFASRAIVI